MRSDDPINGHIVGVKRGLQIGVRNDQIDLDWVQRTLFEIYLSIRLLIWFVRSNDPIETTKLDASGIFRSVGLFC